MDTQQADKMWTFCASYNSQSFEFSGAEPPGVKAHHPKCPTDTYARLPGDKRPVWRTIQARPKEEYKKPTRDLNGLDKEDFVENEWHELAIGDERHRPLATHVRFE